MSFYELKERIFKQNTNFTITLSNPNLRGKIIYPLCDGARVSWQTEAWIDSRGSSLTGTAVGDALSRR